MQRLVPRLVERCADLVGGLDQLAARLHVPPHTVGFWLQGRATVPNEPLVKMMDLVLQDDIARAQQDRRKAPRVEVLAPPGAKPAAQNLDS
jgi:hypothetical protein